MRRFSGSAGESDGEPASEGDDGPDDFHQAEGRCALEKAIDGSKPAGKGEGQDEPGAAVFEGVENDSGCDREEAEDGQRIQIQLSAVRVGYTRRMLLCSVRGCHKPLARENRRYLCSAGHSFDIARSGYLNLLQPQERRSRHPGDSADAVTARRRLHDRGFTMPLLEGIADFTAPRGDDTVLDAGCGDGFYLGSLAERFGFEGHGVDISIPAIDAAARRYPECHWVVANADRFVPYADDSFSLVLSITARMNPTEFRRVLRDDGDC